MSPQDCRPTTGNVVSDCSIDGSACAICANDPAGRATCSSSCVSAGKSCPWSTAQELLGMEPSCSSTNLLNLGSTRSMRSTGRFPSPGSRDISAAVAVAHGNGCMAGIALSDDPAYAVVGVASPRGDSACVALVGCFDSDALCERLPNDVMCAGLRETMSLALDFPPRGARRARTLTCGG